MPNAQDARLMEMEVPCGPCNGGGFYIGVTGCPVGTAPCPDCGGSGTRKPLQTWRKCRGAKYLSSHKWPCVNGQLMWGHKSSLDPVILPCPACHGTKGEYVPNISMETMMEAIRAKGWRYAMQSFPSGDEVIISNDKTESYWKVHPIEGLRGRDALRLALERALEAG